MRKEVLELACRARGQGLVVRHDQRGPLDSLNHVGHGERLAEPVTPISTWWARPCAALGSGPRWPGADLRRAERVLRVGTRRRSSRSRLRTWAWIGTLLPACVALGPEIVILVPGPRWEEPKSSPATWKRGRGVQRDRVERVPGYAGQCPARGQGFLRRQTDRGPFGSRRSAGPKPGLRIPATEPAQASPPSSNRPETGHSWRRRLVYLGQPGRAQTSCAIHQPRMPTRATTSTCRAAR